MIKNYLKIAFRNLVKNKAYAFINIAGLAIGLTGFIVILLYLNYELSYDTWNPSLKKVYKVSERTDEDILPQTRAPLADFIRENYPDIEAATAIQPSGNFEYLMAVGDKKIYQSGGVTADSSFFKVFPFKIVLGNSATALDKPNAIVISEEVSKKLFGDVNPIGKTIKLHNAFENEVTGVLQQPDKPSHLKTEFVYRSSYEKSTKHWQNYSYHTYIKTRRPITIDKLEDKIDRLFYEQQLKKDNRSFDEFRNSGHKAGLFADAVPRLHNFPKHGNSNFTTVSVLLILSVLLLVAGAINFSNLSIAASIKRAREVGVRKVLGSSRRQLVWQFMSEVALQCFISLLLAMLLVNSVLPYFNRSFDINLSFFRSENFVSIALQISLCLLAVIILSGIYPSMFLANFNTSNVLKGNYSRGRKGVGFRNALIVVQFVVAAFFIIGVLVIRNQMYFMKTSDKGFSGEQVLRLQTTQKTRDKDFDLTRNLLLGVPGVQYVSKTTSVPGDGSLDTMTVAFKTAGEEHRLSSVKVSTDYFKTLDIGLVQGRSFNDSYSDQNTRTAVINESAVKRMSLKNPIGSFITFFACDSVPVQIVGVVKDFNVLGFENSVLPTVFTIGNKACRFQSGGAVLIKLNSNQLNNTIAAIEQKWKEIEPDFPIKYSFLDENFQKLFLSHIRLQKVISFFAAAAILISVIGLFALTAFLVSQRSKEISIRKVLGAEFSHLTSLLSRDFIKLVLLAVVIATPLGWWACNEWLQTFAYRINMNWMIFLIAALVIIGIAILTIGVQVIKATVANPVKSLKTE
jgi:putative ABC transport system permease protein